PEAMEHWEEALKLKPDDVEAHVNLGNALQGQGRLPEAIEHYQQALKLRPDFLPAKNALIRLQPSQ
ncbi:MAG: tetratricopeptide repeat protein, partial [Verrucomicrobiia bacterium]